MNVTKSTQNGHILLELEGRLDTTTGPQFQETLLAEIAQGQNIVLDFAHIVYVSSAGLRVLLAGQKAVMKLGTKMTLYHVAPEIMEVFYMTGFADILDIKV